MLFLSHGLTLRLREGQGPHRPHRTSLPLPRVALCPMHPESLAWAAAWAGTGGR